MEYMREQDERLGLTIAPPTPVPEPELEPQPAPEPEFEPVAEAKSVEEAEEAAAAAEEPTPGVAAAQKPVFVSVLGGPATGECCWPRARLRLACGISNGDSVVKEEEEGGGGSQRDGPAGKSTHCRRVADTLGYVHLSVGQLLAAEAAKDEASEVAGAYSRHAQPDPPTAVGCAASTCPIASGCTMLRARPAAPPQSHWQLAR